MNDADDNYGSDDDLNDLCPQDSNPEVVSTARRVAHIFTMLRNEHKDMYECKDSSCLPVCQIFLSVPLLILIYMYLCTQVGIYRFISI